MALVERQRHVVKDFHCALTVHVGEVLVWRGSQRWLNEVFSPHLVCLGRLLLATAIVCVRSRGGRV